MILMILHVLLERERGSEEGSAMTHLQFKPIRNVPYPAGWPLHLLVTKLSHTHDPCCRWLMWDQPDLNFCIDLL